MQRLPDHASLRPRDPHEATRDQMPTMIAYDGLVSAKGQTDMEQVKEASVVREYHAHVYYDGVSRERAAKLRTWVEQKFTVRMGAWRDGPMGPHLFTQYQIAFDLDQFPALVPFLMMNRMGLTLLVHPLSGHSRDDHTIYAMWAGEVLQVNVAFLREADVSG